MCSRVKFMQLKNEVIPLEVLKNHHLIHPNTKSIDFWCAVLKNKLEDRQGKRVKLGHLQISTKRVGCRSYLHTTTKEFGISYTESSDFINYFPFSPINLQEWCTRQVCKDAVPIYRIPYVTLKSAVSYKNGLLLG